MTDGMRERRGKRDGAAQLAGLQNAALQLLALGTSLPRSDPDYVTAWCNLAAMKIELAIRTGQAAEAREATDAARRAVASAPADCADIVLVQANLAAALWVLFELTGDLAALEESVDTGRQAAADPALDSPMRVGLLSNLGTSLRLLGERTGQRAVMEEAAEVGRRAVAAIGPGESDPARAISSLSVSLCRLFSFTGDIALLHEAVALARQAAGVANPAEHGQILGNLAVALRIMGERTGDVTLIEEAVGIGRRAVAATSGSHLYAVTFLSNLSFALLSLFACTGQTSALAEAATVAARAAAATPVAHPRRLIVLSNLAVILHELGERSGNPTATEDAIKVERQVVAATPDDDPELPVRLSNLAISLSALGSRNLAGRHAPASAVALEEGIATARRAVATAPPGNPSRGMFLNNLCSALQRLYELTGQQVLLYEAVAAGEQAVAETRPEHPNWGGYQFGLGAVLSELADATGQLAFREAAATCLTSAADCATAPASVRIRAWRLLARQQRNSPGHALAALSAAVTLLPQVASRSLPRFDRAHAATYQAGLPAHAAAVAALAGKPARAVELLELSRGLLVADIMEARSGEIARLRADARMRGEARRFGALQKRHAILDRSSEPGSPAYSAVEWLAPSSAGQPVEILIAESRQAEADYQALLADIRSQAGFGDFLRLDQIDRLASAAADGPIVYVYADPAGSGALILRADRGDPVAPVDLPAFTHDHALVQADRFIEARSAIDTPDADAARAQMLDVLAWLWDAVAGPVLAALDLARDTGRDEPWPRVWWCPVGFLAYLPFHAAGHHHPARDRHAVLDSVVSSYIPTARALDYARSHRGSGTGDRTLLVGSAAGTPLEGAAAEIKMLASLVPGSRRLKNPTSDRVLSVLPRYANAHFACHGVSDPADASASRLLLDNGGSPLTVAAINGRHLHGGQLAFLSACDTSVTTLDMADEAVHLTAAFQLSGYRHVIGTLWPIDDEIAREIAHSVYSQLTKNGTVAPVTAGSALALHHAVRRVRARLPDHPDFWAAHLHVGC